MRRDAYFCAVATMLAGCADPPPPPPPPLPLPLPLPGDTLEVLASDTNFGPSLADADVAARYYCSTRGKLSQFISRERPHELQNNILPEYSVLTYHCYLADVAGR